jgi:hypothetical protein
MDANVNYSIYFINMIYGNVVTTLAILLKGCPNSTQRKGDKEISQRMLRLSLLLLFPAIKTLSPSTR